MAGRQKSLIGTVVNDKMDKTVTVVVKSTTQHRLYRKIIRRSRSYLAHDDRLGAKPGDLVRILESRPLSRHKRWRVAEIIQRGEVAEIAPREIDSEYLGQPKERKTEEPAEEAPVAEAPAEADPAEEAAAQEAPSAEESEAGTADAETEVPAAEEPAEDAPSEEAAEAPVAEAEEAEEPETAAPEEAPPEDESEERDTP